MTIKEIAALLTTNDTTVLRWIRKDDFLNCKMQLRKNENFLKPNAGVEERTIERWSKNVKKRQNVVSLQNLDEIKQGKTVDLPVELVIEIFRAGGRDALAALLAENAANKNAVTVQDDVSARLDRIEKAITVLAQGINKPSGRASYGKTRYALEHKHDKNQHFYDFIAQNVIVTSHIRPIKRVHIWERYVETVKKADRMLRKAFFEKLAAVFPQMEMTKVRFGSCFQYFCYGIALKSQPNDIYEVVKDE